MSSLFEDMGRRARKAAFEAQKQKDILALQTKIRPLRGEIDKAFTLLGKVAFDLYEADVLEHPQLDPVAGRLADLHAQVSQVEQEIEHVRNKQFEPENEEDQYGYLCPKGHGRVPEGNNFCTECGARPIYVPPPAPAAGFCQNCGAPLGPEARFCAVCGHEIVQPTRSQPPPPALKPDTCNKCGEPLLPNAAFCAECGNPVGAVAVKDQSPASEQVEPESSHIGADLTEEDLFPSKSDEASETEPAAATTSDIIEEPLTEAYQEDFADDVLTAEESLGTENLASTPIDVKEPEADAAEDSAFGSEEEQMASAEGLLAEPATSEEMEWSSADEEHAASRQPDTSETQETQVVATEAVGTAAICANCGADLLAEAVFCGECGHPVAGEVVLDQREGESGPLVMANASSSVEGHSDLAASGGDDSARYCSECGEPILPEAVFCAECGHRVD